MTPSFRCVGGDVVHRTRPLSGEEVRSLDAFYRKEALLAHVAGDDAGFKWAWDLLTELVEARSAQGRWVRASGGAR